MGIILWVAIGLALGSVARAVMPGPEPLGRVGAIAVGIGGALLGGVLGALASGSVIAFDFRSLLMAIVGSLAGLFCYRTYAMRAAY
jgi:uncharacterized membrane protein YeaQ/YmgE (transglycosylase-associated protein family)